MDKVTPTLPTPDVSEAAANALPEDTPSGIAEDALTRAEQEANQGPAIDMDGTAAMIAKANAGLGYLVSWNFNGRWTPEFLREKATKAGIDAEIVSTIEANSPKTASRKASKFMTTRYQKSETVIRFEQDTEWPSPELKVDVLRRDDVGGKKPYTSFDSVIIDEDGKAAEGISEYSAGFVAEYQKQLDTLTGNDLYRTVIRTIVHECGRIPVTRGLYFIGKRHEEKVMALQVFAASLGCKFRVMTLMDDAITRSGVQADAREDLTKAIGEIKSELSKWAEKKKINGRTEKSVLSDISEAVGRAEELREILQVEVSDLIQEIEEARSEAHRMVSEKNYGFDASEMDVWRSLVDISTSGESHVLTNESGHYFHWGLVELAEKGVMLDGGGDTAIKPSKAQTQIMKILGYYGFYSSRGNELIIRPLAELGR